MEESKAEFPKIFKCKCGSERTVIGVATTPLKMNGTIALSAFGAMENKLIYLTDPSKSRISTPAVLSHWDVCMDCGSWYCVKVEVVQVPKQQQPQPLRHMS